MKPTTPIKRGRQKIRWRGAPPPPTAPSSAASYYAGHGGSVLRPTQRPALSGPQITELYG